MTQVLTRESRRRRFGLKLALGLFPFLFCTAPACSKDPELRAVEITKEIDAAFAEQKWELGEKKAQEILALSSLSSATRSQAKQKLEEARSEQQAKQLFVRFQGHKDADPDTAVAAYRDMPETSYYRKMAHAEFEKLRPGYIADHLEKAGAARDNGRCGDFKAQIQLVLDIEPQNGKALELAKKPCAKKE